MTTYTYDERTVSDLHKDAYGFRPGEAFYQAWQAMTPDQKQAEWEFLCETLDRELAFEAEIQAKAAARLETSVADTMALGAQTREQALRWLAQGLNIDLDSPYDWREEMEFELGLPFGYLGR